MSLPAPLSAPSRIRLFPPCAHCGLPPDDKAFSNCPCSAKTPYCSVSCQKADWDEHKKKCDRLRGSRRLGSRTSQDDAIAGLLDQMRASGLPVRTFTVQEVENFMKPDTTATSDPTAAQIEDRLSVFCHRCTKRISPETPERTIRIKGVDYRSCVECANDWDLHGHLYYKHA